MSGKKHVFKMVPGKVFDKIEVRIVKTGGKTIHDRDKITRVEFKPLDSESTIKLELPVGMCSIISNYYTGKLKRSCMEDNGKDLVRIEEEKDYRVYSFVYYGDQLMEAYFGISSGALKQSTIVLKPIKYQYVTWEELDSNTHKCYFSDDQGNIIDSDSVQTLENRIFLKEQIIINDIISSNKNIILSTPVAD